MVNDPARRQRRAADTLPDASRDASAFEVSAAEAPAVDSSAADSSAADSSVIDLVSADPANIDLTTIDLLPAPPRTPAPPRLFIAHAPEDSAFVDGFLLPALGLPPAAVVLSSRLALGAPLVEELARGAGGTVALLVLSPAFFECPWTRLAEQLAQHRGVERGDDATVIPLLLADCDVPLVSRFRVSLDFRNPDRPHWEAQVARLRERLADAPAAEAAAAALDPSARTAPALPRLPCPYPGMRAFTAEEITHFHGRRREIDDLLARLRAGERELYVIGPSGSGKSSLVFAGLVPHLHRAPELAGGRFTVRTMRPGAAPLAALAFALSGAPDEASRAAGAGRLLLVVDQLEELFSTAPPPERAAFFTAVRQLRREPHLTLLFTLRADFYGALMDCPWWSDLDGRLSRVDVGPLRGAALRTAIVAPAAAAGVFFEPALLERLLADAADEPGTLPLLQETLVVLWHQRARNLLRLAEYLAIGNDAHTGLAVTLARRADSAMRALDPMGRRIARRIFLRLVQFGAGRADTRRQEPRAALLTAAAFPAEVDAVLAYLVEHRLITAAEAPGEAPARANDPVFDLSHEILLSAWPTLREWILVQRVDEQRRRMLETKADEWVAGGRGGAGLLDAAQLAELDRWLVAEHAHPAARDVVLSLNAVTLIARSRRRRTVVQGLATAAFIVLSLGLVTIAVLWTSSRRSAQVAYQQSNLATEQRRLASLRLAQSYQESARRHLLDDDRPLQALPYLLEARRIAGDDPALRMLFRAAARSAPLGAPLEHRRPVTSVRFSDDGSRLVTASEDGTTRLWNTATAAPIGAPLPHPGAIRAVALSPDGARLVVAGDDGTARLWDAAAGKPIGQLLRHRGAITAAAFSPDGTRVLTAGHDGTARLWDAFTGAPRRTLAHRGWISCATFSPDGSRVLTASRDATARVWEVLTGEPVGQPMRHRGWVRCAAFSPDGSRVVTASEDHTARLWDAATGRALTAPLEHRGIVERAAFSPDGSRVATASWDRTAQLWNAATGAPLGQPMRHHGIVWSAAFSPDGHRVATASDDATARLWSAATGEPAAPPLEHQGPVRALAFAPDGRRLATASDDTTARVWSTAEQRPPCPPLRHDGAVEHVAFSPDGRRLVSIAAVPAAEGEEAEAVADPDSDPASDPVADSDPDPDPDPVSASPPTISVPDSASPLTISDPDSASPLTTSASDSPSALTPTLTAPHHPEAARLWDLSRCAAISPPLLHDDALVAAVFSPDGALLLTASHDGLARVWNAATGAPRAAIQPLELLVAAAFSLDGTRVLLSSAGALASSWNATSGAAEPALGRARTAAFSRPDAVRLAAFSPDGSRLLTAGEARTARLWDPRTATPRTPPLPHPSAVEHAVFSPDGTRVLTIAGDTARLWSTRDGRRLADTFVHRDRINAAAFSPDGSLIVTAGNDRVARVWNADTGQPHTPPLQHRAAVRAAAFAPDGRRLVTASEDRTARVWDAATGAPLARPFVHDEQVRSAAFSPDGALVVTASADGAVRLWDVALDDGTLEQWEQLADRGPYELIKSLLVLRAHNRRTAEAPPPSP